MYYLAITILHIPEEKFWKMTPRTLFALAQVHKEVNGVADESTAPQKTYYIDQVLF